MEFPKDFLWGAATAAHQVEGWNTGSDTWHMEIAEHSPFAEPSGAACDHYRRFGQDIALLKNLGLNAYRFSVEWARIEPEEGVFSRVALEHYRQVIATCHVVGVTPIVTFHHFTAPVWFTRDGGWENVKSVGRFARYCEWTGGALRDVLSCVCTINEANMPMLRTLSSELRNGRGVRAPSPFDDMARRLGRAPELWAPFLFCDGHIASQHLIAAHRKGYQALKDRGVKGPIGITLSIEYFQAGPGGEVLRDKVERLAVLQFLESLRGDDFIGVQTYTRVRFGDKSVLRIPPGVETTQMNSEFYPQALEPVLRQVARLTQCPILVTENGIATEDDTRRIVYTRRALECIHRCRSDGVDIRAYIHWSLLDNFEWLEGYRPKFGLVEVDRVTQVRRPKPSAYWLGEVARSNALMPA